MSALSAVLPDRDPENATMFYHYIPQTLTAAMLRRSPLLRDVSELLRRNSIEEMRSYSALYSSALDLLLAVLNHQDVRLLLYQDQILYAPKRQLAPFIFSPDAGAATTGPSSSVDADDTTESLDNLLQGLAVHCQYFVQAALGHADAFKARDDKKLLELAQRFAFAAKDLDAARPQVVAFLPKETSSISVKHPPPVPNVQTRAMHAREAGKSAVEKVVEKTGSWHRENCAKDLPDETILQSHFFAVKARALENFKTGRMRKLVTQIASLQANLPEGIFVRYGSSRLDVMKILIVGPVDTPYEYGLFEFDLLCTGDFPQKPPEMQFRTTGGGRVGFNPNLYANGKGELEAFPPCDALSADYQDAVCLSLLGTWKGPKWEANKSTILQLLVSIQGALPPPP